MRLNIQLFANEISTTSTSVTLGDTIRVNITTDASYKVTLMFYVGDSKTDPEIIDTSSYITGNYYDYQVKENVYDVLKETTGTLMISGMVESYQGEVIGFTNTLNLTLTVPKLPTKLVNVNRTVSALAIGGKSTAKDDEELFENYMASKFYKDIEATNVVSRNLFNINDINPTYNLETSLSKIENGIRATALGTGQSRYSAVELDKSLMGKTITLSANIKTSSTNAGALSIFFGTSSQPFLSDVHWFTESGSDTFTIPSTFPSGCDKLFMNVYSNGGGTGVSGAYVDYTNIQIEEGSTATDYVPYLNLEEAMQENEVYSTSEVRIGTWLGKPLYRKVYTGKTTSEMISGSVKIADIPSEMNIKRFEATLSNDLDKATVMGNTWFSNTDYVYIFINGRSELRCRVATNAYVNRNIYAIVEYTKTTD